MAEWFVARSGELADGDRRIVTAGRHEIGVFFKDGAYYAYSNYCLHSGGPACEGLMINRVVDLIAADRASSPCSICRSTIRRPPTAPSRNSAGRTGVVGFMVTSPRYKPVHDNAYVKTYALLEEMGKPISFHAAYNWNDQALAMTNRFISVHALGFIWFNMVHMTNWVINGLPERFPKLKVMWIESGLTWAYSLMQRLDHSYMMRTSDCPSLKRKPSEYMREMYYSTQPMETPEDHSILAATFKMIKVSVGGGPRR